MLVSLLSIVQLCLYVQGNIIDQANLQKAINALPEYGRRAVGAGGIPGISVAVVFDGQLKYAGGFGVRQVGGSEAVTADTVFQLASVSKPLSSSIIGAIATKGQTTWDARTNLPTLTAEYSDPWITNELQISDGFTHRTGILGPAGEDLELVGYNRSTIFTRLKYAPDSGPFRIKYSYSNYGITVASEAASRNTGQSWEDVAQSYLYGPLGMSSTSSRDSDFLSRTNRAVNHYPGRNGTWIASPHRDPEAQAPAGGASSNVEDLAKWAMMLLGLGKSALGEQIVDQEIFLDSLQPRIIRGRDPVTNNTGFYAYGWDVDYRDEYIYYSHAGAFEQGVRTLIKFNPAQKLAVVALCNAFPTGWPEGIADSVFDIALYGKARRDYVGFWNGIYESNFGPIYTTNPWEINSPPRNATASLALSAYVGEYQNDYVGTVRIAYASQGGSYGKRNNGGGGSGLILSYPGASSRTFPLYHWDRDTFYIKADIPSQNSGAIFGIGSDGKAAMLTLDQFASNGGDVLVRSA